MTTTKHTLYEGVLNDDYLTKCEDGSVLLTYYTFASAWSNFKWEKAFYDIDKALRWYRRKFHDRVFQQGKEWLEQDSDDYNYINETPEEYWTEVVYEQGMEI